MTSQSWLTAPETRRLKMIDIKKRLEWFTAALFLILLVTLASTFHDVHAAEPTVCTIGLEEEMGFAVQALLAEMVEHGRTGTKRDRMIAWARFKAAVRTCQIAHGRCNDDPWNPHERRN